MRRIVCKRLQSAPVTSHTGAAAVKARGRADVEYQPLPDRLPPSRSRAGVSASISRPTAELSAVVEQKKTNDLPLAGRNVLSLAALQPGVNGIPSSADFLTAEQGSRGNGATGGPRIVQLGVKYMF